MRGPSLVVPAVKNSPANAGDTGSIPGPGGSHVPQLPSPKLLSPSSRDYAPQQRGLPTSCISRKSEHSNEDPLQPKISE